MESRRPKSSNTRRARRYERPGYLRPQPNPPPPGRNGRGLLTDSLSSLRSLSSIVSSPLGIKGTATEMIRTTCTSTGAQYGVLVLLDVDLLDPVLLTAPIGADARELLSAITAESDVSRALAVFYANGSTGALEELDSSTLDALRAPSLETSSIVVPLATEDNNLGLVWLSGSKEWANGPGARTAAELGPALSVITENACLFTKTVRQRREARALYETCRDIASRLRLDDVLAAIVDRAHLLLGADASHLELTNEENSELRIVVTKGIQTPEYRSYTQPGFTGLLGKAISERKTILTNDYLRDSSFSHPADSMISREGVRAMICAPLFFGDKLLGGVHVLKRGAGCFTSEQADLLTGLANIASVAIENARLYEEERKSVVRLEQLNSVIDSQYGVLKKSMSIHDRLTRVVLDGKGMGAIALTLSQIVGNPVVVEDDLFGLSFFAPSALGDGSEPLEGVEGMHQKTLRPLLEHVEVRELIELAIQQRCPRRIPPLPQLGLFLSRVVAPIASGRDVVGYVSVPELNRTLEELDFAAIEHATTVVALEIAKRKATAEVEKRLLGDLVQDLLSSTNGESDEARQKAAYLGLDPASAYRILIFRIDEFFDFVLDLKGSKNSLAKVKSRTFEAVKNAMAKAYRQSVVAERTDGLVVILNLGHETQVRADGAAVVELCNEIRDEIQRQVSKISVSIGIGNAYVGINELGRSFYEAGRALDVITHMGKVGQVMRFEDLGAFRVIFRGDDKNELVRFAGDVIGKLVEHDRRSGTSLLDTLEAYLLNSCHLRNTAEKLYVHPNTLRYRLERVEDITGLSLSDAETRLSLRLAIKIARVFPAQPNHRPN